MKNILLLVLLLMNSACKDEEVVDQLNGEDPVLESLGIKDYESIIRHPVSSQISVDSSDWPLPEAIPSNFNFDTITEGEIVSFVYKIKNTGSKSLYILDTRVSCGCTVAKFSADAIPPHQYGTISVQFDSRGKMGHQEKGIIVLTNGIPNETVLTMEGFVQNKK